MKRSSFSMVLLFAFATWVFYMAIFFFIDAITLSVSFRRLLGAEFGQEILTLVAGVLMLAPFIVFWDWYVLDRYYPSRVKKFTRAEASQSHPQSA